MKFGNKILTLIFGDFKLIANKNSETQSIVTKTKFKKSNFVKMTILILFILNLNFKAFSQTQVSLEQDISQIETQQNGILESIQCRGNLSTDCTYISSFINISPGDPITEEEITNSKLRLSSITNFESVYLKIEKGSERGKVNLIIEVQEANPFSKEFLYGLSYNRYYNSTFSNNLAARVSHNNLFGSGKVLDFEARLQNFSLNDYIENTSKLNKFYRYSIRTQYVDPNLFGLKKVYFIAGLETENYNYLSEYPFIKESVSADISLGYKFASFSYLRLIYKDNFYEKDKSNKESFNSSRTGLNKDYNIGINYGWNSEDDSYFPTQGSTFNFSFGWHYTRYLDEPTQGSYLYMTQLSYQKNWSGENNAIWSFKFGGTPNSRFRKAFDDERGLALAYAKPILSDNLELYSLFGKIEKGRWYVEPGTTGLSYSSTRGFSYDPGIKTGLRLQSKSLGIIDLYAFYKTDYRIGGH